MAPFEPVLAKKKSISSRFAPIQNSKLKIKKYTTEVGGL
ncbi:hypothetical protein CWATWH0402_5799 [Crocosphaera watsonii WH 0402]|uniref:Uncharacterized protein n=3 Tax=Crocosphaera watsonii TaxID=263511 RepID=T2JST0_CROWT|nr:hypothetical protein CWATWH0003_B114 [Crocosphaera watsonii WH 0003]CCQ55487.1 hypothetical protein CWATWH0005_3532 [Crocosphaera watsonii WH 0005]CCQ68106.1 hypothetical protein CWATWH0402_5799 [Crocosphaera watsonii WH 0402]